MPELQDITEKLGPVPHSLDVVGKLKPNLSIEAAQAEMALIYDRVAQDHYPSWKREFVRLHIALLKDALVGQARSSLMVLFGAVSFVLLIASTNVANLLLARASTRRGEVAIRAAIGAGRARLIRQCLGESVLLAILGGSAGLVLTRWALPIIVRFGSEVIPRVEQATIDSRVMAFTLAVSLVTGLLFGFGPALSIARGNLHDALKDEGKSSSMGVNRLRVRGALVAAELALAIVLLTGAGLMLKSFWRMNTYPPGFAPEKILVMRVSFHGPQYNAWLQKDAYIRELLRRVGTLPGVEAAGVQRVTLNTAVTVEGAPPMPSGKQPFAAIIAASTGYLRAMGMPLLKGGWPREDTFDTLVVNESFVRKYLPDRNPIGRHVKGPVMNGTIVGVVADIKVWQLDAAPSPEVYIAYQLPPMGNSVRIAVRTSGDPRQLEPVIRKLASGVDPTLPIYEFGTLEQSLSDSIAPRSFNLFLLEIFAATAVLMALVGIFGVIEYSVSQRTREIGIRLALGARRSEMVGMVIRQGMGFALAGIAFGLTAAFGLTRFMESLLYDVKPYDPVTFAAAAIALTATAMLACLCAAVKAAGVDPAIALRNE